MTNSFSYQTDSSCWVYLLRNEPGDSFEILFDLDLPRKAREVEEVAERLVYFRRFDNLLDGLGHRLFLKSISETSLRRLIEINNAENRDLKERIRR